MTNNNFQIKVPVGWNGCEAYNPQNLLNDFNPSIPSIFTMPLRKKFGEEYEVAAKEIAHYIGEMDENFFIEACLKDVLKKYPDFLNFLEEKLNSDEKIDSSIYEIYMRCASIDSMCVVKPCLTKVIEKKVFQYGLVKGNLYTVSGVSGSGKTAFAIHMATTLMTGYNPYYEDGMLEQSKKVLYISLEQSKMDIENRIISAISSFFDKKDPISFGEIISTQIPKQKLPLFRKSVKVFEYFKKNIKIFGNQNLTNLNKFKILQLIDRETQTGTYDLVVVDPVCLMDNDNPDNDTQTPVELRNIAINNRVAMLLLTQLTKEATKKALKNETVDMTEFDQSSIRGSSSLVYQSNTIAILGKIAEYDLGNRRIQHIAMKVVKARFGTYGYCKVGFDGATNTFFDIEEEEPKKKTKGKIIEV